MGHAKIQRLWLPEKMFSSSPCFFPATTPPSNEDAPMEAERINQIGNTLQDLSERTQDLRRYL